MNLPDLFDFTQGNLQDYVDCPYRFMMRYVRKVKWPAPVVGDMIEFEKRGQTGARFHRLLQQYLVGLPEARLTEFAAADPNPQLNQWWENFLDHIPNLLTGEINVESVFSTNLKGQRLVAKYDLVMVDEDHEITIFDWKTSERQIRKEWLADRVQTHLYRYILVHAGEILTPGKMIKPEQVRMHYWFAPNPGAFVTFPYSETAYQKDQDFFTGLISEILTTEEDQFFRTDDTRHCRYCVYRSHCDRGIEAGDLSDFDDFGMDFDAPDQGLEFDEIQEIEF